ncbi:hypothetical protein [Streptomyces sp. NPDC018000]|uniref:hypothetical protein n=1 Tax=Streptomyces sp. NPDC018000 TaxID=3365028 RepID=UPI0037BCA76C
MVQSSEENAPYTPNRSIPDAARPAGAQGLSGQEVTALFRSAYAAVYPSGTDD